MKKDTVKSAINLAAVILVPLISERDRIKDHEEVQKAKDLSLKAFDTTKRVTIKTKDNAINTSQKVVSTANAVKNTTMNTAQFVSQKAQVTKKKHNYNQQMKQHIKQEKFEQKQEKNLQKEISKLDSNLSKNMESRTQAENKSLQARQKAMIKEMKQYKNYEAKASKNTEAIHFAPAKPKKIHRRDQKAINQLAKKLTATMEARHAEENKLMQSQQKAMQKEMKQYKNYKFKAPKQKRSLFGFKKKQADVSTESIDTQLTDTTTAPIASVASVTPTLQPTEKAKSSTLKVEDTYDNAKIFEQHRKMMAEHIEKR